MAAKKKPMKSKPKKKVRKKATAEKK